MLVSKFGDLLSQHCCPPYLPQVGVFTGYSSLAVALALPPDGRLVAFDRDAKTMAIAQKYWVLAGVSDKVRLLCKNGQFVTKCCSLW